MASLSTSSSSALHSGLCAPLILPVQRYSVPSKTSRCHAITLSIRAAKLPSGVEAPKEEPKLPSALWGFTENAERWNSRAAMLGIFGLILVEFIIQKGLLQVIGFDVGKGLDLPL